MPDEERSYYRETWGFDPETDKNTGRNPAVAYYYQASIPLGQDPQMQEAGVKMSAQVEVTSEGRSFNRILFERGDKHASVECIHTILYSAPAEEVLSLPKDRLQEMLGVPYRTLVTLPPWEHFAALKSFSTGLAEVGVLELCRPPYRSRELGDNPFFLGFNRELWSQLTQAIFQVAPELLKSRIAEFLGDLLEEVPAKWIMERWHLLEDTYKISQFLHDDSYVHSLGTNARVKLLEIFILMCNEEALLPRPEIPHNQKYRVPRLFSSFLGEDFIAALDSSALGQLIDAVVAVFNTAYRSNPLRKLFRQLLQQGLQHANPRLLDNGVLRAVEKGFPGLLAETDSLPPVEPAFLEAFRQGLAAIGGFTQEIGEQ
jgi:hypothetical protein